MGMLIAPVSNRTAFFHPLLSGFLFSSEFSPTTIRTYRTALASFFDWMALCGTDFPAREHIVSWKEYLKQTRSLATAQTYLAAVRLFFKWTGRYGKYPDIASSVKGVKVGRSPKRDFLAPHQVLSVLDETKSGNSHLRDYSMILLMVTCGLRVSEVAQANVEDLNHVGGEPVLYIHGKGRDGKTDFVNVPKKVASAIRRYLLSRGSPAGPSPLFASVSRNNGGGRMTSHSVSRIVKTMLKSAGFDSRRLTAHSLRHTAVTVSLQAGATLQQVQQFARHSLIMTTQIYAHNLEQCRNPCSSKIARLLTRVSNSKRKDRDAPEKGSPETGTPD